MHCYRWLDSAITFSHQESYVNGMDLKFVDIAVKHKYNQNIIWSV